MRVLGLWAGGAMPGQKRRDPVPSAQLVCSWMVFLAASSACCTIKVGERKAFEPGSALDAPFFVGKQASLSPFPCVKRAPGEYLRRGTGIYRTCQYTTRRRTEMRGRSAGVRTSLEVPPAAGM